MRRLSAPVAQKSSRTASRVLGCRIHTSATRSDAVSAAAKHPIVHVRSRGYGPSSDLLKEVEPHSQLHVEARLHPGDVEVQRNVLALTMPNLGGVDVVPLLDSSKYQAAPMKPLPFSPASAQDGTDVEMRAELLEQTLQDQLATVANLIVERVSGITSAHMCQLEVTQGEQARTLSQLVINCLQQEVHGRHVSGGNDFGTEMERSFVGIEDVVERVGRRVAEMVCAVVHKTSDDTITSVRRLEKHIDEYFTTLEGKLKSTVTNEVQLPANIKSTVVEAIEQTARVQHESLTTVLEDILQEYMPSVGRGATGGGAHHGPALEKFIEHALQNAIDDIRQSLAEQMKHLRKTSERSEKAMLSGDDPSEEIRDLAKKLEETLKGSQDVLEGIRAADDSISDVLKEQQVTSRLVMEISGRISDVSNLLAQQHSAPLLSDRGSSHPDAFSPSVARKEFSATLSAQDVDYMAKSIGEALKQTLSTSVAPSPEMAYVKAAVDEVKESLSQVSASVSLTQERSEQHLLTLAKALSDSAVDAIGEKHQHLVEAALISVKQTMESEGRSSQSIIKAPGVASHTETAVSDSPDARKEVCTETLAVAVESALAPKLEDILSQLKAHGREGLTESHMVTLAETISESLRASAASSATESGVTEARLREIQQELLTCVQKEMGKPQDVDLTPIYKYIDSVITFLKEELSLQETSIESKVHRLAESMSEAVQQAHKMHREALEEFLRGKLAERQTTNIMPSPTTPEGQRHQKEETHLCGDESQHSGAVVVTEAVERHIEDLEKSIRHAMEEGSNANKRGFNALQEKVSKLGTLEDLSELLNQLQENLVSHIEELTASTGKVTEGQETSLEGKVLSGEDPQTLSPPSPQAVQLVQDGLTEATLMKQLDVLGESVAHRNQAILDAIAAIPSHINRHLVEQLTSVEAALAHLSPSDGVSLHTKVEEVKDLVERHMQTFASREDSAVSVALAKLTATVEEQRDALQSLRLQTSTTSADGTSVHTERDSAVESEPWYSSMRATMEEILSLVRHSSSSAAPPANTLDEQRQSERLVEQLRELISKVHLLATQMEVAGANTAALSSTSASAENTVALLGELRAQPEVITRLVRGDLQSLVGDIRVHSDNLSGMKQEICAEVARAVEQITLQISICDQHIQEASRAGALAESDAQVSSSHRETSVLTPEDLQLQMDAQMDRILKLVEEQRTQVQQSLDVVSRSMGAVKESSAQEASRLEAKVIDFAKSYEAHTVSCVRRSISQQTSELKAVLTDHLESAGSLRSNEGANSLLMEEETFSRVDRSKSAILEALQRQSDLLVGLSQGVSTPPTNAMAVCEASVPRWWLLLIPFLVAVCIFLCAYILLAAYLLAFVPLPEESNDRSCLSTEAEKKQKAARLVDTFM